MAVICMHYILYFANLLVTENLDLLISSRKNPRRISGYTFVYESRATKVTPKHS